MMRPMICFALVATLTSCNEAPATAPADAATTQAPKAQVAEAEVPTGLDFVAPESLAESERDPFRSYEHLFPAPPPPTIPDGKAAYYELEQLELTGIMLGGEKRVLLTDPSGYGWIVKVGERVASWRVDEIRENNVVFTREDYDDPELPMITRSKALHLGAPRHARG